jgi:alpha-methylacyl-CoA racemase
MGPLTGVRIVEIASLAPGPFGTMLLADLGAEVIRVERAGGAPAVEPPPGPLDRGRVSIAADLKTAEGVAAVRALAAKADVLIEGFRPGVAERLGIGPEELLALNPRLIYARITGYGQTGPLAGKAGHDINYAAIAGALEPLGRAGESPHPPINLLADFAGGGSFLALGIVAALYERNASGLGQVIDAAMVDGASVLMSFLHGMKAAGQWEGARGTNLLDGGAAFYDSFETSDGGYMAVGSVEPQFYRQLLAGLGLEDRELPAQFDPAGWPATRRVFAEVFATRTRDEWTARFDEFDACVTPVLSPWEAHEHPHHRARESFVEVGGLRQPAPAPRFSRTPAGTPQPLDRSEDALARTLAAWGVEGLPATE